MPARIDFNWRLVSFPTSSVSNSLSRVTLPLPFALILLGVMLLPLCSFADAQQSSKVYRVGRLSGGLSSSTFIHDAVRRELRELGYVEGKNISFELRHAEENPERLRALADELVRLKVDLIIAGGPNDGLTAKKATKTIPIIFTDSNSDPVARGLVDSLARPGGNVTGFYSMADVLAGKRLQVLKESLPKLSRVAVLWNSGSSDDASQWKESQLAARQLGLQLHSMEVSNTDQYESAFKDAVKARSTAVAVTRHRLFTNYQKRIIELAAKYRLPTIHYREDFVESGGLMSYGADEVEPFKRVAAMVDKLLKGTKPADIPVEQSPSLSSPLISKQHKHLALQYRPRFWHGRIV